MGLDIRQPIGALFAIIGVLLTGYGLVSDRAIYARSLGVKREPLVGQIMQ